MLLHTSLSNLQHECPLGAAEYTGPVKAPDTRCLPQTHLHTLVEQDQGQTTKVLQYHEGALSNYINNPLSGDASVKTLEC